LTSSRVGFTDTPYMAIVKLPSLLPVPYRLAEAAEEIGVASALLRRWRRAERTLPRPMSAGLVYPVHPGSFRRRIEDITRPGHLFVGQVLDQTIRIRAGGLGALHQQAQVHRPGP
jgi:hypothetical protein